MMTGSDENDPTARGSSPGPGRRIRRLASSELLGSARELLIEHRGETYRLFFTRQDKLILTK
jgi:hemin uptake protein HemP